MIPYNEIEPRTCICFVYAELFMKHNIISMRKRWNILSVNLFFRASSFVTVFLHGKISASQNNYRTFLNPYSLGLQTYSIKNAKCIKFVSVVFFSSFKCSAEKIFIQALVGVHMTARLTVLGSPCRKTAKKTSWSIIEKELHWSIMVKNVIFSSEKSSILDISNFILTDTNCGKI